MRVTMTCDHVMDARAGQCESVTSESSWSGEPHGERERATRIVPSWPSAGSASAAPWCHWASSAAASRLPPDSSRGTGHDIWRSTRCSCSGSSDWSSGRSCCSLSAPLGQTSRTSDTTVRRPRPRARPTDHGAPLQPNGVQTALLGRRGLEQQKSWSKKSCRASR